MCGSLVVTRRDGSAVLGVRSALSRGSSTRNTIYNSSRVQMWLRDTAVIEWPLPKCLPGFPHWARGASGCSVGPASAELSGVVETYIVESVVPVLVVGVPAMRRQCPLHQTETRGTWARYCSGARCLERFLAPVAVAGDRGGDCVGTVWR